MKTFLAWVEKIQAKPLILIWLAILLFAINLFLFGDNTIVAIVIAILITGLMLDWRGR